MKTLALLSVLFFISCENVVKSQWIPKQLKTLCPSIPEMRYDALGRRQSGNLVPPSDQGSCGSCWAFAGAHTFADQVNINSNSLVAQFSPDHLARCSPYSKERNGCCGGSISASIRFFRQTGAYPKSCYPYTLEDYSIPSDLRDNDEARIQFKNANPLTCPKTCANGDPVPTPRMLLGDTYIQNSPSAVIAALNRGPVYIVMSTGVYPHKLQQYGCGVFDDPVPFPSQLSGLHAVEIVDYSSSSYTGTPFYVVKNSWGRSWGEKGYFRIVQNSRLITERYSFSIGGTSTNSEATSPITSQSTCSPVKVDVTQNTLVTNSTIFALEELNSMKLLTCIAGSGTPMVEQTSVINATEQVVAGMITDVALEVAVTGCEEDSAILRVIVLENMNGSFTLLDFSYSASGALLHIHCLGLMLALIGLIFGLNLL